MPCSKLKDGSEETFMGAEIFLKVESNMNELDEIVEVSKNVKVKLRDILLCNKAVYCLVNYEITRDQTEVSNGFVIERIIGE